MVGPTGAAVTVNKAELEVAVPMLL